MNSVQALAAEIVGDMKNTITDKSSKDDFLIFGAALAVLGQDILMSGETHQPAERTHYSVINERTEHSLAEWVEDELQSAKKYVDMDLPEFAKHELIHAGYWLDALSAQVQNEEEKSIVQELITRHGELAKQIAG